MEIAALCKWDPVRLAHEAILSHVLLLVLVKTCTEIKPFAQAPIPQPFLAECVPWCSVKWKVSLQTGPHLTGVALPRRQSCLRMPCLRHSYRPSVQWVPPHLPLLSSSPAARWAPGVSEAHQGGIIPPPGRSTWLLLKGHNNLRSQAPQQGPHRRTLWAECSCRGALPASQHGGLCLGPNPAL